MNLQLHRFPFSLVKRLPGVLSPPRSDSKCLYLTFDDGPDELRTPQVLDILRTYGAKATFFCLGEKVRKSPRLFARIKEEGHTVGNHGYYHLNGWHTPYETYMSNVAEAKEYIDSTLFRPPYGHLTLRQYLSLRKEYQLVFWDVMAWDFGGKKTPEESLSVLKRHIKTGRIVVLHDYRRSEVHQFLEPFLRHCRERDYQIRSLTFPN